VVIPLRIVALLSLGFGTSATAHAQEPLWPMANGSHDLLHSFQNPFSFSSYFHEGVDLRGSLDDVVAKRSGTVRYVNQGDSGGTLLVETPGGECDSYLHILIDPWIEGDPISAGDVVGQVNDSYFSTLLHDHVHVNRFTSWAGGSGYVVGRTNMLNPLAHFAAAADRDPQLLQAAPHDANEDGSVFLVTPNNQPTVSLPYAFGAVDLMLEADDRLSGTLYWNQGLHGVGYWIDCVASGDDVASGTTPYRLVRFNDAWRASSADCDSLVASVMMTQTSARVQYGPDDTGWYSLATYKLTNTSGFAGLGSTVSATQAWKTDARIGGSTQNGTGAQNAREIQECRFPDGRYVVHGLTEDLEGELDSQYPVVVDNFRPYVKRCRVSAVGSGEELYLGEWTFQSGAGQLVLARGFSASGVHRVHLGDELRIEVEFSEPMASATLVAIDPPVGTPSALTSTQAVDHRTSWSATVTIDQIPSVPPLPRIRLSGTDLAGTTLYPFANGLPLTAPFNKRANATPITNPTEDHLHVIPLFVRHVPIPAPGF